MECSLSTLSITLHNKNIVTKDIKTYMVQCEDFGSFRDCSFVRPVE
jgi:hypothetical protein